MICFGNWEGRNVVDEYAATRRNAGDTILIFIHYADNPKGVKRNQYCVRGRGARRDRQGPFTSRPAGGGIRPSIYAGLESLPEFGSSCHYDYRGPFTGLLAVVA